MPEERTDTLNYFEDTYIGRQIRRTRRSPLFQVSLWNIHNRTIDDLPQQITSLKPGTDVFLHCAVIHTHIFGSS